MNPALAHIRVASLKRPISLPLSLSRSSQERGRESYHIIPTRPPTILPILLFITTPPHQPAGHLIMRSKNRTLPKRLTLAALGAIPQAPSTSTFLALLRIEPLAPIGQAVAHAARSGRAGGRGAFEVELVAETVGAVGVGPVGAERFELGGEAVEGEGVAGVLVAVGLGQGVGVDAVGVGVGASEGGGLGGRGADVAEVAVVTTAVAIDLLRLATVVAYRCADLVEE